MSDQASFGDFTDDGDDDRPPEEAAAVAGNGGGSAGAAVVTDDSRYPAAEGTLRMAVTQVDYTVEGRGDEEYPVVHVFGRTPDGTREHVRVLEFEPYFYTPTAELTEDPVEAYGSVLEARATGPDGEPFESIRGEELTKIVARTPRDVGSIRDDFRTTYEADILFPNRFLIDAGIGGGVEVPARRLDDDRIQVHHSEVTPVEVEADLRVNTFDIEVDDRNGFPEDGEEPIVCLTSHDSYRDEYVLWVWEPEAATVAPPDDLGGYEQIDGDAGVEVRTFETETAMLDDFLAYIETTDPDVLTGWNFEDFDAPYLLDRLEMIAHEAAAGESLAIERLSRVDEVWRGGWGGPDIKGRVVFDLLYAYKRTQFTELESYRLDAVAELELDVGKERYSGDIGDLWEQEPERLLEYNLRDVELCVEIDRKQSVIAFWDEVRRFVGCLLEDAPTPGDAVDVYVLHNAHGRFALPTKGQQESEEFEGGAVFEPVTGVRENVTVLDLKCFSGDTQLLTPEGIRDITEVEVGDPVYTLNPETFECEVKPVAETHQYHNRFGELHHLSGNTHDLKITENHRLLVSAERGWDDQTPDDFAFAEYRDIPEGERFSFPQHEPVSGTRPETFDLVDEASGGHVVVYCDTDLRSFRAQMPEPVTASLDLAHGSSAALGIEQKVGKYLIPLSVFRAHREVVERHADHVFLKYGRSHRETPLSFETDDWLRLLGWYVTEGSVDRGAGRLTLHQNDADGRRRIRQLLDRMGINHNVDRRGVNVSNRYLLDWLVDHCGEGAADKRLPDWVFDLDGSLLRVLLDTMVAGDGSRTEPGLGKFWTSSDRLKEAVTRIAVRCGEKPTVTKQTDGTWYVSIGKRGSFEKATNAAVEDHDGDVFCVTAEDNHTVLAGRNGHFQWVGQSLYPMCMVTINASPETKVDPEEYDGDTYHAPNGTHFRAEPDGMMREMVDELLTEREEKKARRDQHEPEEDEYVQFDRQQAATKVIMNCFTPDTEVLTPSGVRDITDLTVGDDVYSLDPETMEMEVKPVVDTQAYPDYRDELVDIQTSKIDFRVTPNHRMLVRKAETNGVEWDDYRFVEAGDLDHASNYQLPHDWNGPDGERVDRIDLTELVDEFEVWCDNDVHGHTLKAEVGSYPDTIVKNDLDTTGYVFDADEFDEHRGYLDKHCSRFRVHAERGRKWVPRFYDGDDFLDLLAWYITEGSVYTSETKEFDGQLRGSATSVQIAQDAPAATTDDVAADGGESDHAVIGSLLDRMGFDYYVDDRGYQFTSRLLGRLLERSCGGNSFEKRIPDLVFEASREQKRRFLDTLVAGDGDRGSDSAWRYTTSSERLRDDVLRLCAHLGLTANYNHDSGSWRIYCGENAKNTLRMHRSGGRSTAEDGVYCVTVADNHTLLAGRNGRFQFVGQSLYGVSGWDRFRLYDKENAAAVTATGREVLSFTEDVAEEMNYKIAYGDTDSVMLELGSGVTKDEAIDRSFDIEDHINDRYDDFAREQLGAAEHRFQIEFEKLYRRFFQAGKKKRYAGHIVWKEGKDVDDIDITGFEYKRSDIAQVTKRVQREIIEMIVRGEDLDEVKEYLHEEIAAFESGERSLAEVGIPGGIGKRLDAYDTDTAQVRGARYANEFLGTNFGRGSKPKRVYLRKVHPDFFERMESTEGFDPSTDPVYREFKRDPDVICFEYDDQVPDEFEVDWDRMLEKTLQGPIARVIEALGMSWDEVRSGQTQTGLGQFG